MALFIVCTIPSLFTGHNAFAQESIGPPGMKTQAGEDWTPPKPPGSYFIEEVRHHIFLYLVVVLFSVLLRVRGRLFETREEKLNAELSSLKAQINPHFLFNTLNSIYALTVKKDDKASDAVVNLAGLMRYIIKDANSNKIPLRQELDYITNYIELQKSRLRDTVRIQFTCTGDMEDKEIAPLILITYIENAFKYGVNPDEDTSIMINIEVDETKLHLQVSNNKVRKSANIISTGIGIENTKERLKLLYPEKHQLNIQEDDKSYTIHLTIHLP